jgi:hypothetical protein
MANQTTQKPLNLVLRVAIRQANTDNNPPTAYGPLKITTSVDAGSIWRLSVRLRPSTRRTG